MRLRLELERFVLGARELVVSPCAGDELKAADPVLQQGLQRSPVFGEPFALHGDLRGYFGQLGVGSHPLRRQFLGDRGTLVLRRLPDAGQVPFELVLHTRGALF